MYVNIKSMGNMKLQMCGDFRFGANDWLLQFVLISTQVLE